MKQVALGRSGLQVSQICLGTMTFGIQADAQESFAIMDTAWEAGINFIDTADMYPLGAGMELVGKTEEIVGDWLKARGVRHKTVLATKCNGAMGVGANDQGLSRRHIMDAVDASLKRLKTDFIDLYQAHQFDTNVPLEETLWAFSDLVQAGKVRYIGVSNWKAYQVAKAMGLSERKGFHPIVSVQPRYNLLYRDIESELLPYCQEEGIGVIPFNPLAGGLLTGKYNVQDSVVSGTRFSLPKAGELYQKRYWNDPMKETAIQLKAYCEQRGLLVAQVALAWVMAQGGITAPILGASKKSQLQDTLPATELTLTVEDFAYIEALYAELPRQ